MAIETFPEFIREHYEIHEVRHASAVLERDFPREWQDIIEVLTAFRLPKSYIVTPGGSKSQISAELDAGFAARGWKEAGFSTKYVVDDEVLESATHKIDSYKNGVGVEVEWNSKDQTFDRDLNNFRVLFDLGRLSVGVIITRTDELQALFDSLGTDSAGKSIGTKYGASTTHMGKLLPRLRRGNGGGCPVLVFGITRRLYVEEE